MKNYTPIIWHIIWDLLNLTIEITNKPCPRRGAALDREKWLMLDLQLHNCLGTQLR
jgi:hypothetical protein